MRQAPTYLIIGNGRVARHFIHYFNLLSIPCLHWHREHPLTRLHELASQSTHILLLISDDTIEGFIQNHLILTQACLIHFSGSVNTDLAFGAHPLMTFSHHLYSLDDYKRIAFVIDECAPEFSRLLPGLPNTSVRLTKSQKQKYHAMCVMAGNFSCLLWQKLFSTFENEFNMPASAAYPYLQQQMKNLQSDYQRALTGPLVRNDQATIDKNLSALEGDAFQSLYQSFVHYYRELKNNNRGVE